MLTLKVDVNGNARSDFISITLCRRRAPPIVPFSAGKTISSDDEDFPGEGGGWVGFTKVSCSMAVVFYESNIKK